MQKLKSFLFEHFEKILVLVLSVVVVLANLFIFQQLTFLNFYYLPVLVSGYVLGRRMSVLTALFCVALVVFTAVNNPVHFEPKGSDLILVSNLSLWGGFLILAGYVVGTLYEQKEKKIQDLKNAYVGVLEILAKYLESYDRYTRSHSLRVADYATSIAMAMGLPRSQVENIKVAALLHDIGKVEISSDLIKKAAALTDEEKKEVEAHPQKGLEILSMVGGVLKEAMPIVEAHHTYFADVGSTQKGQAKQLPVGARILAVADSFDAMVTDRPYRKGKPHWEAVEELDRCAGTQFDPQVVDAFKRVYAEKAEVV
ncbi:MAG: HD domain-containing phosphohydrolase [Candidatus Zixiibacteriota bacterium]